MFDVEKAVADWRRRMQMSGLRSPEVLDELESHLRDDIGRRMAGGMNECHAFELAVRSLGEAIELKREFMKTANSSWTHFLMVLKKLVPRAREIPLPTLENFEPTARYALELAPEEARQFNHDFVGTEHLLLGLMQSGSKTVFIVMQRLGLSAETVRSEVERFVTRGLVANASSSIPFTPRARQALQLAADEARQFNQRAIKAEHIFLGLLREGGGVAAMVFKNLQVQQDSARAEILKEMKAG